MSRGASGVVPRPDSWTHTLNKGLIAVGVIAFGVIVTDRVLEAFRADDVPARMATVDESPGVPVEPVSVASSATAELPAPGTGVQVPPVAESRETEADFTDLDDREVLARLKSLFGSRVVFVSAAEPAYVLTEDERRFDIGRSVNDSMTLAGVAADQLIFEKNGERMLVRLPDPAIE